MVPQESSGQLLHNLLLFGRVLRYLGLDVNPGRMIDLVQALEYVDIGRRSDFYHTARSLLVNRREEIPLFDQAFALFWRKPAYDLGDLGALLSQNPVKRPQVRVVPASLPGQPPPAPPRKAQENGETPTETVIEVTRTYSDRELLRRKDFSELNAEELAAIKKLMRQLVWEVGHRRTRRRRPGRGHQFDLRRSLRRNLRYGGELLEWPRLVPQIKPRPLVILADISGSMERYARLLLHFVYSLAEGLNQPVEAFVFSTRLTRVTRQLHNRDVDQALRDVARAVPDWSGGTRIGEALKRFNFDWGRRVLRGGAVVLLISDGWDRGDVTLLGKEMARLQRSSHRLVWLNPLLGSPSYEPLTRGMVAALPFVDDFLPVHNLASLEQLAGYLARLNRR